jgi:hypothetical protein
MNFFLEPESALPAYLQRCGTLAAIQTLRQQDARRSSTEHERTMKDRESPEICRQSRGAECGAVLQLRSMPVRERGQPFGKW